MIEAGIGAGRHALQPGGVHDIDDLDPGVWVHGRSVGA
jgi:hypothetical protein